MNGIKRKQEISEVFQLGKRFRISNGTLIVYTLDQPEKGKVIKLLIMIKKKLANSVRRNRIRRVIREAVRTSAGIIPDGKEVRLIFLVNHTDVDFHKLKTEVENKLKFIFGIDRNKGNGWE
jgi:ribonuclease P protein component